MTASRTATRTWLETVGGLLAACGIFAFAVRVDPGSIFHLRALALHEGLTLPQIALLAAFSALSLWRTDRWGLCAIATLALVFMAGALADVWTAALTDGNVVAGLLPFSDASAYYRDAVTFVHGGSMSAFSGRRPLFAGLLATFLWITNNNLQLTLVIFAALGGLALALAAFEVRLTYGTVVGTVFFVTTVLFARTYTGKVLTENLGLPLGALGLAVLVRAARRQEQWLAIAGLGILTVALLARAGTFFVIPMLWCWIAWTFRGTRRIALPVLSAAVLVTLLGFAGDRVVRAAVAAPSAVPFANFSYTLYGVVTGNTGWLQVTRDHPEVNELAEPELSRTIYRFAFDALRANPGLALAGVGRTWIDYMRPEAVGAFSFVSFDGGPAAIIRVREICYVLAALGLVWCAICWRRADCLLLLAGGIGILLSVPLVPPLDADGMRAYAATIPSVALIVALGVGALARLVGSRDVRPEAAQTPHVELVLALGVIGVVLIGPVFVSAFRSLQTADSIPCGKGQQSLIVRVAPGSYANVVDDGAVDRSRAPNVRLSDVRANNRPPYRDLIEQVDALPAGTSIVTGPDLGGLEPTVWLFVKSSRLPTTRVIMRVCARPVGNTSSRLYRFFWAETLQ